MDAPPASTASRPHRLEPRYPLSCELRVRGAGVDEIFRTRDVSRGGVFLGSSQPLELFAELTIALPNGVEVPARVMHIVSPERARVHGIDAGMGVQFEPVSPEQSAAIRTFVEAARQSDPRRRVPQRLVSGDVARAEADPILGYVLQAIDGERGPEELAEKLGLQLSSVESTLAELSGLGVVELRARAATLAPPPAVAPVRPSGRSPRLRKLAGMAPHVRVELIELWSKLGHADHYQVLGVPREAGREEIRHAFFERSKRFHPDAHYRRELGDDLPKLERVFARLSEAYGVIGRAASRAEYDRYLQRKRALTRPPPAAATADATNAVAGAIAEQHGPAALAIQPQPRTPGQTASRDLWDSLQGQAARRELLAALRAQAAYEEKHQRWGDAAETWQRVCRDDPRDAGAHRQAARALQHGGRDLQRAVELAKRAVELEPSDAQNRRVLGQLYLAAGARKKARAELEAAAALQPTSPTIPAKGRVWSS